MIPIGQIIEFRGPQSFTEDIKLLTEVDKTGWVILNTANTIQPHSWQNIKAYHIFAMIARGCPSILVHIREIAFSRLSKLILAYCRIESIDQLSRIQMATIEQIDICHNNITCVRELGRVFYPKIQQIDCNYNMIGNYDRLSSLYAPKLKKIYTHAQPNNNRCNNAGWASKLETNILNFMAVNALEYSENRQDQPISNRKFLLRKYPSLIFTHI